MQAGNGTYLLLRQDTTTCNLKDPSLKEILILQICTCISVRLYL